MHNNNSRALWYRERGGLTLTYNFSSLLHSLGVSLQHTILWRCSSCYIKVYYRTHNISCCLLCRSSKLLYTPSLSLFLSPFFLLSLLLSHYYYFSYYYYITIGVIRYNTPLNFSTWVHDLPLVLFFNPHGIDFHSLYLRNKKSRNIFVLSQSRIYNSEHGEIKNKYFMDSLRKINWASANDLAYTWNDEAGILQRVQ